ncbi:MAG: sensor histidine kinase [Solirubrobacterales bacterium]|nr:sensor histidine kinase [Solirubrobacterales bacterium]
MNPSGWIRRRDVRLAAMCGLIQIAVTAGAAHHVSRTHSCWWASACRPPTRLDAGAYALLALGPLALVLRRRYVRPVLVFVFAVTVAYVARGYLLGPNFLSFGFAIVSAVFAGARLLAWAALGVGWLVFLGLPWALGHSGGPKVLAAVAIAAWLLVALAGAEGVRGRRERFAQAKRARELQARRQADEERLRIARELHDVLAHNISLINVQSGVALHLMDEKPEQARIALTAINQASADALREVRSVLGVMRGTSERAPRGPTAGLDGLDDLVSRTAAAGVGVTLEVHGERRPLPASIDLAAFRIVQEALTNIVRHAGAGVATVELTYGPNELTVQVDDDGHGPDPSGARREAPAPDSDGGGNGIPGMRERAVALGGTFDAGPRSSGGFRVRAQIPLPGKWPL